jgi:hypothetical protein
MEIGAFSADSIKSWQTRQISGSTILSFIISGQCVPNLQEMIIG